MNLVLKLVIISFVIITSVLTDEKDVDCYTYKQNEINVVGGKEIRFKLAGESLLTLCSDEKYFLSDRFYYRFSFFKREICFFNTHDSQYVIFFCGYEAYFSELFTPLLLHLFFIFVILSFAFLLFNKFKHPKVQSENM